MKKLFIAIGGSVIVFGLMEATRKPLTERRIRTRIGEQVFQDFTTTSPVYAVAEWSTNVTATGLVVTAQFTTNKW